jgi:hypothetical protein
MIRIAAVGLLAAAIFAASALAQEDKPAEQPKTDQPNEAVQQPTHQTWPLPPDRPQSADADWAKPKCENPQSHDEADLCEQRRMSKAAEDTVNLNKIQIVIGAITIFGLALTVYYARKAANAADDAAKYGHIAAEATVIAANAARDSADALPALERAYVFVELSPDASVNIMSAIHRLQRRRDLRPDDDTIVQVTVMYRIKNYGKTPAIVKSEAGEIHRLIELPDQVRYYDNVMADIVVCSSEVYPPREDGWFILNQNICAETGASIERGDSFLWVYGHILYQDVFGSEHETRFCWRYNGSAQAFEQYDRGKDSLNRRT